MGRDVAIHPMRVEDLSAVFRLGNALYPGSERRHRPWKEDAVADILSRNLEFSRTAQIKKKIVGFVIGAVDGRQAVILWTGIDPAVAAPGLEERLVASFIDGLADTAVRSVRIEIPIINGQLNELFDKIGFTEIGRVLIMERILANN